jgi:2-polyprenyl-3-methyl-5-hydroxy-6-metoxy-1,4-benzoquinol methylase
MSEIAFDKYAIKGAYHWVECFGPIHRLNAYTIGRYEMISTALAQSRLGQHDDVLDVGCGDAALTGLIAMQTGANVHGIDTTELSITLAQQAFAKRSLPGSFQKIDGYRYPYEGARFSAVVCSDVIEHVRQPEVMLREMWRLLRTGGVLVLTTPVRYTEKPLDPMHVQEWFPDEFKELCATTLGVPVELKLSHPVALAELYASGAPIIGRVARLAFNIGTKLGHNPFLRTVGFRAFSTQTVVARKP